MLSVPKLSHSLCTWEWGWGLKGMVCWNGPTNPTMFLLSPCGDTYTHIPAKHTGGEAATWSAHGFPADIGVPPQPCHRKPQSPLLLTQPAAFPGDLASHACSALDLRTRSQLQGERGPQTPPGGAGRDGSPPGPGLGTSAEAWAGFCLPAMASASVHPVTDRSRATLDPVAEGTGLRAPRAPGRSWPGFHHMPAS